MNHQSKKNKDWPQDEFDKQAETTRISTKANERDVIIASDTDNDEPVVIPTAETKNKIKNSIASSITFN